MAMSDEMSDTYVHGGCCWRCGLQSNVRGLAVSEVIYQGGDSHHSLPASAERAQTSGRGGTGDQEWVWGGGCEAEDDVRM